jgi:nitric oxide reductase NorD protein
MPRLVGFTLNSANSKNVLRELQKFPQSVQDEYRHSAISIQKMVSRSQFETWGQQGVMIALKAVRSWEAASEYFRVSPYIMETLPFPDFLRWADSGVALCQDSSPVASSYFRASQGTVHLLGVRYVTAWANLGRSLYKGTSGVGKEFQVRNGTWRSSALSAKFFELSPNLASYLTFRELKDFVALLDMLFHRSYDAAFDCLQLGPSVFPEVGQDKGALISLVTTVASENWREVRGCLEVAGNALHGVDESQRSRLFFLTERMVRRGISDIADFLSEAAQALGQLEKQSHPRVIELAEILLRHSPDAVVALLKNTAPVRQRLSEGQFEMWFNQGVTLLRENLEGGVAYFKLESSRSDQVLDSLSVTVELDRIQELLGMYCRALAGSSVDIQPIKDLVGKGIGWVCEDRPSTDGTRVFLPSSVGHYAAKDDNFAWFKVVATHQVAHLEFGSFIFDFDRPSARFRDLRTLVESRRLDSLGTDEPTLNSVISTQGKDVQTERLVSNGHTHPTDMSRFFSLFPNKKLALDIFTAVEDGRLDYLVTLDYKGIAPSYMRVQTSALSDRPKIDEMPLQQAMVELLVRLSLDRRASRRVPLEYRKEARAIVSLGRRVMDPRALVEDSSEATIRIYALLSGLPNQEIPPDEWEDESADSHEGGDFDDDELEKILDQFGGQFPFDESADGGGLGDDEEHSDQRIQTESYESPPQVDYRGDFKPEMTQLLATMRRQDRRSESVGDSQKLSKEQLQQLLEGSAELDQEEAGQVSNKSAQYADNLMKEAGVPPRDAQPMLGVVSTVEDDDRGGSLESNEPMTFLYDEWDFRAIDYKPRWCVVREKSMEEGETDFFAETLRNHSGLMSQIRRQFEMLVPEMFRKIRPLQDGEDIDLDAAIQAMIDKISGLTPSDKIYWRRNKIERDIAVVFLLDMSASTAEAIDESGRIGSDWNAPDDPVEYMLWLRSRRSSDGMNRRPYKRIIDIEKESLVLLTTALETVGDVYGIYGFSGYGRENVEFYVIKDIDETFSDRVKRRVDKIVPLHATRMGPAIRHATSKLEIQDARTKLLFLISDGRPQDRNYSREGVEKEYAVHDTKKALTEARMKNITPFCLTVDKAGHDYLKTMCSDIGYEILHDVKVLPKRLPMLYRSLTM